VSGVGDRVEDMWLAVAAAIGQLLLFALWFLASALLLLPVAFGDPAPGPWLAVQYLAPVAAALGWSVRWAGPWWWHGDARHRIARWALGLSALAWTVAAVVLLAHR
jgi:hypothetical protein